MSGIKTFINEDLTTLHPSRPGQSGVETYLAVDRKGRLIVSPLSGISISAPDTVANSPSNATVNQTSAEVVAQNSNRSGLILTNESPYKIYLAFGISAEIGKGILLNGNGGTFNMDNYCFTVEAVHAISSGVGANLTIQEFGS